MSDTLACGSDLRRGAVRRHDRLRGIDYVELGEGGPTTLRVVFLGRAPEGLTADHLRLEGGARVRDIRVLDVDVGTAAAPEDDDWADVRLDRFGDASTYTLRLVGLDDVDPRFAAAPVDFRAECVADIDCVVPVECPEPPVDEPALDYLAKDYAAFRRLVFDRLAVVSPQWRDREVPDLGVALVELLAYVGDHLSYRQDAVATEAYLGTARRRASVRRHARLVDYRMHEGCNARAWVRLTIDGAAELELEPAKVAFLAGLPAPAPAVVPREALEALPAGVQVFEPVATAPIVLRAAHNVVGFHTWGEVDCCLPAGATSATLVDRAGDDGRRTLHLAPGDVLLLAEVIGPGTGNLADADPERCHAVRLTSVTPAHDPVADQPVVEVAWGYEDALPFPLCLSTLGPPPDCARLHDVSVAYANVVLVDHGERVVDEALGAVPEHDARDACDGEGTPAEEELVAGRYEPRLARSPLVFREPAGPAGPASAALVQDPARALPALWLEADGVPWTAVADLLASDGDDRHVVVEVDDERVARLRFGDDVLGRAVEPGDAFTATYRVGGGAVGNVGAGAVATLVLDDLVDGVTITVSNPSPAAGGTEAETLASVRKAAPTAFRTTLVRAVTADDYAALAMRHPGVSRAAATLRWTGSAYEARVAVDPAGAAVPDDGLLAAVAASLERFRRMGHDVAVVPGEQVALDLDLHVCVRPDVPRSQVHRAVRQAVLRLFRPDAVSFGHVVRAGVVLATVQAVDGVQSVEVTRLERLFEGPNGELEAGILRLGPLEVPRLDDDPAFPERGRLGLTVGGGR